jgi:plasmid stability protein
MHGACYGASCMSQHLQVRNLSDATHRALKARAAREGRSLSDLVREELDRVAARPSRRELFERIERRGHKRLSEPLADVVRRMRDRAA